MDTVTQTDTPGTQQTAAPDTQSNMTIVTNPGSTRLDEILSDLSGGNKASDPPAATTAAPATSTAPPANGSQTTDPPAPEPNLLDGDPNLILMRGDYLKRMNAIADREKELEAREAALKNGTTTTTQPAKVDDPANPGKDTGTTPPASWKPKSNEYDWQEPGDKVLAEDIKTIAERNTSLETMVTKMYEVNAAMAKQIDVLTQNHHEQIAGQISEQINTTVSQVKQEYGIDLTPEMVASSIQKMSKVVLNGANRLPADFAIKCWLNDPDNRTAYEAAVRAKGGNPPAAPTATTTVAAPAPLRQGGGRTQSQDGANLSVEDKILKDLEANRQTA